MNSEELTKILSIQQKAYNDATQMLFNSLNQRIDDQNKLIYDLKNSLEYSQAELRDTKIKLADYVKLTNQMKEISTTHSISIDKLQLQVDHQEDYSRFNNVRIEGLLENKDENIEQIQHRVSKLFSEKMHLNDISIEKIHRLPHKQNNTRPSQPRTIIARLTKASDRSLILRNSHKLKNSGIYLNDDVSEGTMKARKEQLERLKEAKSCGKVAYFIGRRLVIHDRIHINKPRATEPDQNSTPIRRNTVSNLIEVFNPDETSNVTLTPQPATTDEQNHASPSVTNRNESNQNAKPQTNRKGLRPLSDINYKI